MPYIPNSDAGFNAWLVNFEAIVAVDFASLGLVAGDATALTAAEGVWTAAYALAINPATRTPVTVADKDAARASAESLARSLAMIIKAVIPAIDPGVLTSLGLTVDSFPPTPVAAPTTFPVLDFLGATPLQQRFQYRDSSTPTSKAKPYGVQFVEIWSVIGVAPAVDVALAGLHLQVTKSPFFLDFDAGDVGKYCTIWGRYINKNGLVGPWSSAISAVVTD